MKPENKEQEIIMEIMQFIADTVNKHDIDKRAMLMSLIVSLMMTLSHNENLNERGVKALSKLIRKTVIKALRRMEKDPGFVGSISIDERKHYEN